MEELEHSLYIVELFNKIFGRPVVAFLGLLGIEPKHPESPIPDYIVMCILVAAFLIVVFGLASRRLSIIPSRRQSVLELIVQMFEGILTDVIGEQGKRYLPMIGTVGIFVFSANMLGLVPGFMSPTSKLNVTAGCALAVFVYYHWQGMKSQGILKYLKHFTGPIPALAPLLLPIEIISHFSRPVSLSLRLFGNIFAEELLIVVIASIVPFILPLPFMAIAIFTATIQAFVFVLLACIYIAGAVAHEEEHS
ncbi:MAG: F0F1 ATP synthase subunit A [Clostridiales bacterium]|jgi:F-type H+-transporting ATPase subunit a|nr:F0F1 ATP synthase subunit A [Clostridiales bacterium]